MFEHKLKKISKEIFNDNSLKKYFILTHKKHKREMYFQVSNKEALNFAKSKFNSKKKKIIFSLLKMQILQTFLKKIKLSSGIGEVIFVGGQIKGFDLGNKKVNSFFHTSTKERFLKDKKDQEKFARKKFSPKIFLIDSKNLYSQEDLFEQFSGSNLKIFERLRDFYKMNGLKKINSLKVKKEIKESLKGKGVFDPIFKKAIKEISKLDYFLFTKIHGDFAKEQCLLKNNKIYFVDWNFREGLITEDLVNFFRMDEKYFEKELFKKALKNYPDHTKENLKEYLILTELFRASRFPKNTALSKKRIDLLLKNKNSFSSKNNQSY